MTERDRIRVDRKQEMRTMAISKMISEGGLGADNYYHIIKDPSTDKEATVRGNLDENDKN